MARPQSTKTSKPTKPKKKAPLFRDRTVLFHWLLQELGVSGWDELARALEPAEGAVSDTVPSVFAQHLKLVCLELNRPRVQDADIDRLDARIVAITNRLNDKRSEPIRWKYFQYIALFFTELYLDSYLGDRAALAKRLNDFLGGFEGTSDLELDPYGFDQDDIDDLAKVAFWMATGSGKTLVMHANLLQYLGALERHGRAKPEHILLVTPSAGLSVQHERELRASGIPCARFEKGLRERDVVTIVEITSLKEKSKDKTVAVRAFESKVGNLVLVDEGHRGSSKEDGEWRTHRQTLAKNGFAFEYSATFAQAAAKDPVIQAEYAKCILVDYSYFRFFEDGYGKHWQIMNIKPGAGSRAQDLEGEQLRAYLTGALVVFYQQLETYAATMAMAHEHRIAKPFCLFAGKSVTGGNEGKDEQSDMTRVLGFLATFVAERHRAETERILDGMLKGTSEFRTDKGRDVFDLATVLPELARSVQNQGLTAAGLYRKMLERIFNTKTTGILHVAELKEADGEIALAVGHAPAFGVVNVGDAPALRKKIEGEVEAKKFDNVEVAEKAFGRSLFHGIDAPGSELTMLIGSRKFTEGWSSWRVSLMGLLNIGRSQGTQIIQLFGRGVRLRGKDMSLKRSSPKVPKRHEDQQLKVLETLNVFGVRADYMDAFEDELKSEGFEPDDEPRIESLPVVKLEPRPKLFVLRLPTVSDWKRLGAPVVLSADVGVSVLLDAYPRVQVRGGTGKDGAADERAEQGPLDCFLFVKHEALYADLVHAKALHGWSNLALPRKVALPSGEVVPLTQALLAGSWYQIKIPRRYVEVTSLSHITLWQQLATELVVRYAEETWELARNRYQTEHAQVVPLETFLADPSLTPGQRRALEEAMFPTAYDVLIPNGGEPLKEEGVVEFVRKLAARVNAGQFDDVSMSQVLVSLGLDKHHLYDPLVHVPKVGTLKVKVSPVALNEGEYAFVRDLKAWLATKPALLEGATVHVLRNPVKRGIGFRDAKGFYPDFLVWVMKGSEQWLTFVDPKGLRNLVHGSSEFKVRLWEQLKAIEKKHPDLGVHLDAWLLSKSRADDGELTPKTLSDFPANHIVWQDPKADYIPALFKAIIGPQGAAG